MDYSSLPPHIADALERLMAFMAQGGDVLWLIFATALMLWMLAFERFLYFSFSHKNIANMQISQWQNRADKSSWFAHQIRQGLIARMTLTVKSRLTLIAILVAICPLLGLLGTVTGMIEVFDTMGSSGSNNARAMASGVSKATIPTLAGMIIALCGLFIRSWLDRRAKVLCARFSDHLEIHQMTKAKNINL